jgi:hypothetical protein
MQFSRSLGHAGKKWGGLEVYFFLLLVVEVTPLQHVQNDPCRMMHSPVTRDQKWRNRNLVIFPPFSTPQGGERGGNQKVPLTANSSQVPVECVGILGGQAPTLFREYSPPKSEKKFFVGFRTTFGSFRIRSAISVRSTELRMLRHRKGTRGMCHTHFPDLADFGRILPNAVDRGYTDSTAD